jgi:hypothetical protein
VSAYGEFETILCAERFLVEGLTEMGYEVKVHADGSGAPNWTAHPMTLGLREERTAVSGRT